VRRVLWYVILWPDGSPHVWSVFAVPLHQAPAPEEPPRG
jgi:hypothetical protein